MKILVTGGCGFIGSACIRQMIATGHQVVNIDKLTYAGDPRTVAAVADNSNYSFIKADIADVDAMRDAFETHRPDAVLHLAAESHVDRSINGPTIFIDTNVVGTSVLLGIALDYWRNLSDLCRDSFRFVHVSTDEVYGALGKTGKFSEQTAYDPSSPYSASKAASDLLARAWQRTYGLPVIVTNCSNNYGPYQYPEKLIPTIIKTALAGEQIPVYGKGENIRDWLYVEDHVKALALVIEKGKPGETYNIGGDAEIKNIDIVRQVCSILDRIENRSDSASYSKQIHFVTDRPGHDFRYAIDASKINRTLGWQPDTKLAQGLKETVFWYLQNRSWWDHQDKQSGRLGLID